MMTGANRDPLFVERLTDIFSAEPVQDEGQYARFLSRSADEAQAGDAQQTLGEQFW